MVGVNSARQMSSIQLYATAFCSSLHLQVNVKVMKRKFSFLVESLGSLDSDGVNVPGLKLSLSEDLYRIVAEPQYNDLYHF